VNAKIVPRKIAALPLIAAPRKVRPTFSLDDEPMCLNWGECMPRL
jgi:hypothetical protein